MLHLHDVTFRYGAKTVLRNIQLSLAPRSITLVGGANGAGKSTLLRLMAGFCQPDSGSISRPADAGSTGYLGHQTLLYPELTAVQNLRFWAGLHGSDAAPCQMAPLLQRMGLEAYAHEPVSSFSRGMAQRLSLARLFLLQPRLILLDEPETGLDTASRDLLLSELLAARDRGAALVWVSHHLATDAPYADSLLVLDAQSIRYHGPAAGYQPGKALQEGV